MEKLQIINIAQNPNFGALPGWIGKLSGLRKLSAAYNQWTSLPEELGIFSIFTSFLTFDIQIVYFTK